MTNEELYRQYLSGDAEAFEQLYLQMQGFIASVAKDAAQSFGCADKETLDELCAEGALELCECLSTGEYDEARGKLTTYLHPFLRGKMYRYLEANLGAAVLPKDEMQRVKQAQRLHKEEMLPLDDIALSPFHTFFPKYPFDFPPNLTSRLDQVTAPCFALSLHSQLLSEANGSTFHFGPR